MKYKRLYKIAWLLLFFCAFQDGVAQRKKVWIDADTGNEMDDLYALVRILQDTSVEVVGLSSAHFNNPDLLVFDKWNQYDTKDIHTVQISQQLNEALLVLLKKSNIPHPLGADKQMGRAWGGKQPRDAAAVQGIIAAVKQLNKNEKLNIISLGALTNTASAMALDTNLASHVVCYALGAKYNIVSHVWNKNEFNIRNDLNAFDYLLDNPAATLVLMPIDVASPYRFVRDSVYNLLRDAVPVEKMLKQRWQETNPQDAVRTLWDLALVEAFLQPAYATMEPVLTPPENLQRSIKIYARIDAQKMTEDFFQRLATAKK